jgi:hypothetical protein
MEAVNIFAKGGLEWLTVPVVKVLGKLQMGKCVLL